MFHQGFFAGQRMRLATAKHWSGHDRSRSIVILHVDTPTFYDRISGAYDLIADAGERTCRDQGLHALNASPGERILEVRFGTGHALAALALAVVQQVMRVAFDLSTGMMAVARRTVAGAGAVNVGLALNDAIVVLSQRPV